MWPSGWRRLPAWPDQGPVMCGGEGVMCVMEREAVRSSLPGPSHSSHFGHQSCTEAPLVVIVGGNILHDPRTWVVHLGGPTSTTGHVDHLGEEFRVQSKTGEEERTHTHTLIIMNHSSGHEY